jgi:methionine sulfoxide reductase heme-binding subunit
MNEFVLRFKRHYLPLLFLTFVAAIFFYICRGNRNTITFITQATGYISLIILSASLIIGSINLLMKIKNPVSTYFRRDISIVGGTLAILHSVTGLFVHLRGKTWLYFMNESENGYSIRLDNFGLANYSGLLSALIILFLLIISNDYFLKKLSPSNWKNLQRLSYIMYILIIIHCYYYRIGKENLSLFYLFYIPLVLIILTLQVIGIRLKKSEQTNGL